MGAVGSFLSIPFFNTPEHFQYALSAALFMIVATCLGPSCTSLLKLSNSEFLLKV